MAGGSGVKGQATPGPVVSSSVQKEVKAARGPAPHFQ